MRHVPLLCARAALLALVIGVTAREALAAGAEIVMLQGKGDKSEGPQRGTWVPASQGDVLEGGYWVRTQPNSQMALMVPERNQIRLNQNSEMQLKTADESAEFKQARVKLAKGRAWSQSRPRGSAGAAQQPSLAMETPSATLSIRGTDWEVEVADDGTTQVVVLSGQVEVGNEQGEISVGKGEAAKVEVGKAPVKLVLLDPESRVQWVSAWQPQPARWIGAEASLYASEVARIEGGDYEAARVALETRAASEPGAAVMAADLEVHAGNLARAVELLQPHAGNGSGDARASALLARTLVRLDKLDESERLLDTALGSHPGDAELLIARGELAVLRGEPERAEAAFRAALDAAESQPLPQAATGAKSSLPPTGEGSSQQRERADLRAEAWYGLGLIAAEREYVREARHALDESLAANPEHGKAAAERASVETFANNLDDAAARYDALLAREGDNYEALTGRGINRLKQGDANAALDDFLKAGVIEPRYARSWLYQGVAFYQQGERMRAAQAFAKAEELDARDPIPHMMASQTASDRLDFGAAIKDARAAQDNMPYLRSLNQLANDQKGSANLGSPIAAFGMEEWAKFYADEAYSPYWGGSHLFLADRYTGPFTKSSELMQGFLTDPLAFGASNRDASLVARPGHYGRVDSSYVSERGFNTLSGRLTASGLLEAPTTLAYFAQGTLDTTDSRKDGTTGDANEFVGGIGWRPRYDLGVFAFVIDRYIDADIEMPRTSHTDLEAFTDQKQTQPEKRVDLGLNYKLGPSNQIWMKAGAGEQLPQQHGALYSRGAADAFEDLFSIFQMDVNPNGELKRFDFRVYTNDAQFRQSLDIGDSAVSWGMERSRQEQKHDFVMAFDATTVLGDDVVKNAQHEEFDTDDETLYLSTITPWADNVTVQADIYYQDSKSDRFDTNQVIVFGSSFDPPGGGGTEGDDSSINLNPRLGVRWDIADGQMIRVVGQRWRRPGSLGTLADVDTLGIVLNDRLPSIGGKYDRLRFQYDGEFAGRYFFEVYGDREVIDNGEAGKRTPAFASTAEGLAKLRSREEFFTAPDLLESTPVFMNGSVSSLGLVANVLATDNLSVSARYIYRYGEVESDDPHFAEYDGEIPYVPHHYFEVGSQLALPWNWHVRGDAIYRSRRFQNNSALGEAQSGWVFRLKSYWETVDKHHSVQVVLDNLFLDKDSMIREFDDQYVIVQYAYRF